ncbi:hypothetical protein [Pseudoalteromonas luteoviolacea]|uniref:hypothetical protein n=1 Tax=Pseudoalteromonas luteoviolacea TaxID=43657 RepID=UPI001B398559|nr:hypothetical protein [Pseudoalteromonas luteoviolacea]MBQ4840115.1 hypothetical protein [Pseudoalteromonas luteoviolacea]
MLNTLEIEKPLSVAGLMFPDDSYPDDTMSTLSNVIGFLSHVSESEHFVDIVACRDHREGFSALLNVSEQSARHAVNQAKKVNAEMRDLQQKLDNVRNDYKPFAEAICHLQEYTQIMDRLFNFRYLERSQLDRDTYLFLHESSALIEACKVVNFGLPEPFLIKERERTLKRARKVKSKLSVINLNMEKKQ